jgi:hypothetical protein
MQAHRVMIEKHEHGQPKDLPALAPHAKVEAIFLVLEQGAPASAALGGLKITGDIVSPAIDEADWPSSRSR